MSNISYPSHVPLLSQMWFSQDINETHYGPSRRNSYIIHYVLSGKGYFNGNEVKKGEGFLIRPNDFEHYYADKKDPWCYLWIISPEKEMEYFFSQHNANPVTNIFTYKNGYVIENVIQSLKRTKNGVFLTPIHLTEYFLTIYNNCVFSSEFSNTNAEKLYFNYAINYINTNSVDSQLALTYYLSLQQLSEALLQESIISPAYTFLMLQEQTVQM